MSEYKRLTNNNADEYDPEYDFCIGCKYFGEPNGCNRPNGTCSNYERFIETYNRLAELEDKIENGTLVELPCNETPTADVQEVRHGHWIEKDLDNFRKVECSCSICGWSGVENYDSYVDIHDFDFCPHCGALMDGDDDEAKIKELEGK